MRHHAKDVSLPTYDTRDVAHRAVGVVRLLRLQAIRRIAEDDLAFTFESIEGGVVRAVATVAVRDGQGDQLIRLVSAREARGRILDAQRDGRADELERGVPQQCAGKQ